MADANTDEGTKTVEEQVDALAEEVQADEADAPEQEQVDEQPEATGDEAAEGDDEGGEDEEPAEKPMSRREQLRVAQLLEKLKAKDDPRESSVKPGLDYSKALEADEATIKTLDEDRKGYGDQRFTEGLEIAKSMQFRTLLEIDAPKVISKYPVLDPSDKENFNPHVADALNKMYLATVGFDQATDRVKNPDIRYVDYIDSLMELVEATAGRKVAATQKNITKQAAQTALRPDGSSPKKLNLSKAPEDMDDAELDAIIAQVIPSKKR